MKRILLLGTGGTIACKRTSHGLMPLLSSEEILSFVPDSRTFCSIDSIQVLNIDSTNIQPSHWLTIEKAIEEHYKDYDGFVITHGTDTMAYTAAALSYLIRNSAKPIVITGPKAYRYGKHRRQNQSCGQPSLRLSPKRTWGQYRIRRQGDRRHPRKGAHQELQRLFQYQFSLYCHDPGGAYPFLSG